MGAEFRLVKPLALSLVIALGSAYCAVQFLTITIAATYFQIMDKFDTVKRTEQTYKQLGARPIPTRLDIKETCDHGMSTRIKTSRINIPVIIYSMRS
ncbi:hypothetical protein CPB85DRAFT_1033019 [Mucidula mucida]|nr:hypothetical protein CPB85DRAFT_1033019 [Mucidula mucida]